MLAYVIRRLIQSVFTVFGVVLLSFLLFRVVAGDISAAYVNERAGYEQRQNFLRTHKLDRPMLFNVARRLEITDRTKGEEPLSVVDAKPKETQAAEALGLLLAPGSKATGHAVLEGRLIDWLSDDTPLAKMIQGPLVKKNKAPPKEAAATQPTTQPAIRPTTRSVATQPRAPDARIPTLILTPADGRPLRVTLNGVTMCGQLLERINNAPDNHGRLVASISHGSLATLFDSQFFWHLAECVTFSGESYQTKQKLSKIIAEKARYSLSITVPAMALGWLGAMVVSMIVAYFRGTWIDHVGVFLSVLGMCVPFLAFMILGQYIMFEIAPSRAWGLARPTNVYVPVLITVIAGLGTSVRFYRTIFLNEFHQDYVRTARAKGVPLPSIMFKHVLKNSMLPILTNVVISIPFLIMGSLLLEQFFGVPGLGGLMINSITSRDVPIINALVFLTAIIYVLGLLLTDILYAVFDPRIRLQ